jgi:hypothetical protein
MTQVMGRSRLNRCSLSHVEAATAMVVTALAIGWFLEPTGTRADQDRGRAIVVREPGVKNAAEEPPAAFESTAAPATHAVIVDSDLDLDLDFATAPRR